LGRRVMEGMKNGGGNGKVRVFYKMAIVNVISKRKL